MDRMKVKNLWIADETDDWMTRMNRQKQKPLDRG